MDLPQTFAALADETRFGIVSRLLTHGASSAGGLVEGTGLSGPTVSRHLKVLREAGLVEVQVDGTHRIYTARPEAMRAIAKWTFDHRAFWAGNLDRLDALLALDPDDDRP
ncbi:ArsR/SmtB family transcription factor [Vannielia litorea]|uniref:Transcriptional regulator, ArsR family n=1 Tax=Vannielia litorea TaxID=1217970 RepID=A0A1N6H7D3_9RHOB|nr:metalloregulator ArsR/SmtB family transcription factor [Vannielia litorea]SIO15728.1 transcriptional regulator, ArsR family [Vannielia litorea]